MQAMWSDLPIYMRCYADEYEAWHAKTHVHAHASAREGIANDADPHSANVDRTASDCVTP